MIIAEQFVRSHINRRDIWVSPGINRNSDLFALVDKVRLEFDEQNLSIGERGVYQIGISDSHIAIGFYEGAQFDRSPFLHEHLLIFQRKDITENRLNIRYLCDQKFLRYVDFRQRFDNGDPLAALSIEFPDSPLQPEYLRTFYQKRNDLNLENALAAMFSMAAGKQVKLLMGLNNFEQALDFLSAHLSLLPVSMSPNLQILIGMVPKQKGENITLWIDVKPSPARIIGEKASYKFAADIMRIISLSDNDYAEKIQAIHKEYQGIYALLDMLLDNLNANEKTVKSLESPDKNALHEISAKRLQELLSENNVNRVLDFTTKAILVGLRFSEAEIYQFFYQRVLSIFGAENGDLEVALNILRQLINKWGKIDELTRLEREITLLNYIRCRNVSLALTIFPVDHVLDQMESFFEKNQLKQDDLIPFFSNPDYDFKSILKKAQHPHVYGAFELYRIRDIITSLNREKIRQNPHLVEELNTWLIENPNGFHRNIVIKNLTAQIMIVLDFDPKQEMEYLINPRPSYSSLLQVMPEVLLSIKPQVSTPDFQAMVGKYVGKVALGMAKENKKGILNNTYDYLFNTQSLHRVFFSILYPSLRRLGWPNIGFSDKSNAWFSGRLEKIIDDLREKHGEYISPPILPSKARQQMNIQNQNPVLPALFPNPGNAIQETGIKETELAGIIQNDKIFWQELRKTPKLLTEKYANMIHIDNNRIRLIFDRMEFDSIQEMHQLINGPDREKSLFAILPASLKYFSDKMRPLDYSKMVSKLITRIIDGTLDAPVVAQKSEPSLSYRFGASKTCEAYYKYLDRDILELIYMVKFPGEDFNQAYDVLKIISGNLAWTRMMDSVPKTISDREFNICFIIDNKTFPIKVLLSEIIKVPGWTVDSEPNISIQNTEMLVRTALSKKFPNSIKKWDIQIKEWPTKENKGNYIYKCTDMETVMVAMVPSSS
jgi:hypothetical protein